MFWRKQHFAMGRTLLSQVDIWTALLLVVKKAESPVYN
jgi:hypothetical protein